MSDQSTEQTTQPVYQSLQPQVQLYPVVNAQYGSINNSNSNSTPTPQPKVIYVYPVSDQQLPPQFSEQKVPLLSKGKSINDEDGEYKTQRVQLYPKRVYNYAKSSRSRCCCIYTCVSCCCFAFIALIVGIAVGFAAFECTQMKFSYVHEYPLNGTYNQIIGTFSQGDVNIYVNDTITFPVVTVVQQGNSQDLVENEAVTATIYGGTLWLNMIEDGKTWYRSIQICQSLTINIQLPPQWSTSASNSSTAIDSIQISPYNGDVNVNLESSQTVSTFQVYSHNGDVTISALSANVVYLSSVNGNVKIEEIQAPFIHATSENGDVKFEYIEFVNENPAGTYVYMKSTNGNVKSTSNPLDYSKVSTFVNNATFTTTNGNVEIEIVNFGGLITASSANGKVSVYGAVESPVYGGSSYYGYSTFNQSNPNSLFQLTSQNGKIDASFEQW